MKAKRNENLQAHKFYAIFVFALGIGKAAKPLQRERAEGEANGAMERGGAKPWIARPPEAGTPIFKLSKTG